MWWARRPPKIKIPPLTLEGGIDDENRVHQGVIAWLRSISSYMDRKCKDFHLDFDVLNHPVLILSTPQTNGQLKKDELLVCLVGQHIIVPMLPLSRSDEDDNSQVSGEKTSSSATKISNQGTICPWRRQSPTMNTLNCACRMAW